MAVPRPSPRTVWEAIGNNKPECMTAINKHGGNINHVNVHGETALTRASKTGAVEARAPPVLPLLVILAR